MATKQNGVLATFTPTVSKYTNKTTEAALGQITASAWMMYTVPAATLMSGKLLVSNNTGGAATINVGLVEQTEVLQLDALGSQPNDPDTGSSYTGYGQLSFPNGTANDYTTSIAIKYSNLTNGPFQVGETLSWTNTDRGAGAASNMTAIIHYVDAANSKLWIRNMTHPLGLQWNSASDHNFSGGTSGAGCSIGTSYAGTTVNVGHSGKVRFYDSLMGRIFFNNFEFRNNLDYAHLYANDANENREQNNNNVNRSNGRIWRPVATTTTEYNNAGSASTPTTEFIDANGVELLISSVAQCAAEQFIVQDKSVNDNDTYELSGLVLGSHQSIFVSSSAAVTFNLIGFEETAEASS